MADKTMTPTEVIEIIREALDKANMRLTAHGDNNTNWLRDAVEALSVLEASVLPENWWDKLGSVTLAHQMSGGFYLFSNDFPKGVFGDTERAAMLAAIGGDNK